MDAPATAPHAIERPKRTNVRNRLGGIISLTYLVWATHYGVETNALGLGPEKLANFLAGIFAPLAFLWLVLGFFQQGDELRLSGDALWLQGEELRNSVEQQRQLVETQRDAIAFERDRLATASEELKRRAQPDLVFTSGGWSSMGEVSTFDFELLNRGAACRDLRITVEGILLQKALFATGESIPFHLKLNRKDAKRGIFSYQALFVDALGEEGSKDLRLIFFEANGVTAVEDADARP